MIRRPVLSARPAAAGLALAAAACAFAVPALAASSAISYAHPVATVGHALPLFRLSRTAAPTKLVTEILAARGEHPLAVEAGRFASRDGAGVLQAYADPATGDAQVFPDFGVRHGAVARAAVTAAAANAVFARADILPKDATSVRLGDPIPVFDAPASRGSLGPAGAPPTHLFTYVSAVRYAAGLPVVGNGSQATVAIDNDGTLRGLMRRWQAARPAGSVAPTTTVAQLTAAIDAQLRPLALNGTNVVVDSVAPAYYDGNGRFLQPVYEFYATLHPRTHGISNDHVRGFVPVGKLVEALPVIGRSNGIAPAAPHPASGMHTDTPYVSFGEYANRDGSMLDMANAYENGYTSVPAWQYGAPFDRTQWYWAYSYEVQAYANSYLNAVQVAYTQPHGDWYVNTTYSNNLNGGDPWYVTNIGVNGDPGYGAASGGQLSTWIIDSCEVVPSYYDLQYTTGNGYNAFNAWWPVFQGLHRVLGFRTEMLLGEDSMNYTIAQSQAVGANAVSAFFNGVAAVGFPTYQDYHLNNMTVHYDRVSVMYDPRNANESIYATQGQTASGQLHNVWMGN